MSSVLGHSSHVVICMATLMLDLYAVTLELWSNKEVEVCVFTITKINFASYQVGNWVIEM